MASIERTAYPRLKRTVSPADLDEYYTPSAEEIALARGWTRGPSPLLSALLLLKTFQRLGYFPALAEVPQPIVDHVRRSAGLLPLVAPESGERALSTYRQAIRATLGVVRFEEGGREIASAAVAAAAAVKDHPADLVNVTVEELFRLILNRSYRTQQGRLDELWGVTLSGAATLQFAYTSSLRVSEQLVHSDPMPLHNATRVDEGPCTRRSDVSGRELS